jgi:mannitol-1-/sugar-/sorbitol-6-phosphatase
MTRTVLDCDAVLFDMDGTIVDSRAIVERMWVGWATEHGISVDAALKVAHGRRTLESMQLLAPEVATSEEAARLDALEEEQELDGGESAIAGALELLSSLPRDRWAVVTSAGRALAQRRIARVGLPTPSIVIGADDVAAGKPNPEGYLKAAACLGVDPRRCVVFEDTPPGAEAGRAAGARVVGLTTTYGWLPRYDARIVDLHAVRLETPPSGAAIRLALIESPVTSPQ